MTLPKSLVEGYRRFLRDHHGPERGRYRQLAELGQAPTAMVIACCDARVDVSAIFDTEAGELFILRNVANLVPPYEPEGMYHGTSAAIEFAALVLKVETILRRELIEIAYFNGVSDPETLRDMVLSKLPPGSEP